MAGLREKQKAHRRDLIESAAGALFIEQSFEATTIEEIADRAVVSPATVYNYYGSKSELLLALVARGEVGIAFKLNHFIERADREDPAGLVTEIIMSNVDDTLAALSRHLWGHVIAYIATTSDPNVAPRYLDTISQGLAAAIEKTVDRAIQAGKIKGSVDSHQLAQFLTRMERIHFLNFVYLKDMDLETLGMAIATDVELMFKNLCP